LGMCVCLGCVCVCVFVAAFPCLRMCVRVGLRVQVGLGVDLSAEEVSGASYSNTIGSLTDTTSGLDGLEERFSGRANASFQKGAAFMYGSALSYNEGEGEEEKE
jgi:hypothetical protein